MKKILLLLVLLILSLSCNFGSNHYHDGEYVGDMDFFEIRIEINGNEIIVNHSIAGVSKLECKQFKDYIEVVEPGGVKKIIKVLEDGDLEYSDWFILKKIKFDENDKESVGSEGTKEKSSTKSNYEEKWKLMDEKIKRDQERSIKQALEDSKNIDLPPMDESIYEEENLYKIVDGVPMVKVGDDWYEDIREPIDSSEICSH